MSMHDGIPESIEVLAVRNLSTRCPHCRDTVALIPAHGLVNVDDNFYFVAFCPNRQRLCCKPIFAVYQHLNDCIEQSYPIPEFDASSVHQAVPEGIREDFAEGLRCLYVDAYKAAVTMFRRVVEATACDKLHEKAKDSNGRPLKLGKLIDLLQYNGLITQDVTNSAHELRHFGNYGAHVQDDGLDKVECEEAHGVRELAEQLLGSIYVAPFKTNKLRRARAAKGES